MNPHSTPLFTATPDGIFLDGLPLSKSASRNLSPHTLRYVQRASELLTEVRKEDWDSKVPHATGTVPILAKLNMLLALASPRSFEKFSPDQPRVPAGNSDGGQWTSEDDSSDGTSVEFRPKDDADSSQPGEFQVVINDGTPAIIRRRINSLMM